MQETKRHGGRTQLQGGPVARTNSTSGLPGKQRQPNQDGGAPSVTCTRTRDGAASVKSETPTPAAGAYGAEASVSGPLPASGGGSAPRLAWRVCGGHRRAEAAWAQQARAAGKPSSDTLPFGER